MCVSTQSYKLSPIVISNTSSHWNKLGGDRSNTILQRVLGVKQLYDLHQIYKEIKYELGVL